MLIFLKSEKIVIVMIAIVIGVPVCSVMGLRLLHWIGDRIAASGHFEPVLDARLVPTAEKLLNDPLPQPSFIAEIFPSQGRINAPSPFCVEIAELPFRAENENAHDKLHKLSVRTRLLINGHRLAVTDAPSFVSGAFTGSYTYSLCTDVKLPSGLHLFEVQVRDHDLGWLDIGPVSSYQWAYRVP